ncbi:hypothetical protein NUU61_008824 [Penicillium alfredii]|uniref:Uncharacterized protein n=1 Tax=Penicillium alfredii TaxID=1506179 RepID=A0A9W9EM46_9EURO|nr:uncharacterized protein NUU61_008824 [Penicillium alfredii]KAJ5084245.1 hypothetical protein NUU61_008824 [Penicillium alfredii]
MKFTTSVLLLGAAAISAAASIPNLNATVPTVRRDSEPAPGCTKGDGGTYFAWTTCKLWKDQPSLM